MICPRCNRENSNTNNICYNCGLHLRNVPFIQPQAPTCPNCHNFINIKDKKCRICNYTIKKKSSASTIILIIAIVIAAMILFGALLNSIFKAPDDNFMDSVNQISEKEYKESCKEIDYKSISRDNDCRKGERFKFTGEIIQVTEDSGKPAYRINVTKDEYGSFNDDIVFYYYGDKKLLEDDIVTIYGESAGAKTYKTVLGVSRTVPCFKIAYADMQ